jgi:hypothetical protein
MTAQVKAPSYNPKEDDFKNFIKTIALSTTAFFAFNPKPDVVRGNYAKIKKIDINTVPKE